MADKLPDFISPMLAKIGKPFDSERHFFEVKWDGIRALTFVDASGLRMLSRNRHRIEARYPELGFLESLPPGTVLDGEIVVLRDGRPDFSQVLSREQARNERRIQTLRHESPAIYVAFDLLYRDHRSTMQDALVDRREQLQELAARCGDKALVPSDGVAGAGIEFFEQACSSGLEGVVAKRMDSAYLAGKRTDAWLKIKRTLRAHCLILGFIPKGARDLKSLVIATDVDGTLRHVGQVGSGIGDAQREELLDLMRARPAKAPIVPCPERAEWVEPGLYCTVSFLERQRSGMLRAPVFEELILESE